MILLRFTASGFRNIDACDIAFLDGVNLLHGKNAQGKTNVIEGIYLFSRGKSFRAKEESELVKFGEQGFRLSIEYRDKEGVKTLEYALFGKDRLRKKNGYKIKKVTEMIGSFKSVLFYPDNLNLVKGGPEERRTFLNVAISQCYPDYMRIYSDYKKALENRNCILKFISKGFPVDRMELTSWSESMAEYASFVYLMRREYIERLRVHAAKIMDDISGGGESFEIIHECDIEDGLTSREDIRDAYKAAFSSDLDREIAAGVTLHGPHRDDLKIKLSGNDARYFASQGQQRSIVLSLKLAEGEIIKELFGEYPVFLFDDVLSELDTDRRNYVLSGAKDRQIIITSCDPDECVGYTQNEIDVYGGRYVSAHR